MTGGGDAELGRRLCKAVSSAAPMNCHHAADTVGGPHDNG